MMQGWIGFLLINKLIEYLAFGGQSEKPDGGYCGWIKANEEDKNKLIALGVHGQMKWVGDGNKPTMREWTNGVLTKIGPTSKELYGFDGHFSHCKVDDIQTLKELKKKWPHFYAAAFTAVDQNEYPLPNKYQKAWKLR